MSRTAATTRRSRKGKLSERVWEFAGDFIRLGKTTEHKQCLVNTACSAWNIACAPHHRREQLVDQYMVSYQRFNPDSSQMHIANVRSDLEKLVGEKLRLFPHDRRHILEAQLICTHGTDRLEVVSGTFQ